MSKVEMIRGLQSGSAVYIVLVDATRLRCPCNIAAALISDCCDCCTCALCLGCCRGGGGGGRSRLDDLDGGGGGDADESIGSASSILPYQGHFVVACGFDSVNRFVLYRNPCRRSGSMCSDTVSRFEAARSAEGTDDDVIVVTMAGM